MNSKDSKDKIAAIATAEILDDIGLYEIDGHKYVIVAVRRGGSSVVHAASCWCQEGRRGDVGA